MNNKSDVQYALEQSSIALREILEHLPAHEECYKPDCPDCMPWRLSRHALKMVTAVLSNM